MRCVCGGHRTWKPCNSRDGGLIKVLPPGLCKLFLEGLCHHVIQLCRLHPAEPCSGDGVRELLSSAVLSSQPTGVLSQRQVGWGHEPPCAGPHLQLSSTSWASFQENTKKLWLQLGDALGCPSKPRHLQGPLSAANGEHQRLMAGSRALGMEAKIRWSERRLEDAHGHLGPLITCRLGRDSWFQQVALPGHHCCCSHIWHLMRGTWKSHAAMFTVRHFNRLTVQVCLAAGQTQSRQLLA